MGIWKSLAGMIRVELTSADTAGRLREINMRKIQIFDVQADDELTVRFSVQRQDYPFVEKLAEKNGESLKTVSRQGLYWKLRAAWDRPVLVGGLVILVFLVLFLPTRVLFVSVEGNESLPAKKILEAAEESGIRFGASRRSVRSEKMKNALLSAVPELQWAGVNTYGCVAVITVQERSVVPREIPEDPVCSIVASRDGVIVSCTVTRGSGLCQAGQAVQAGEMLISGYTDCGISVTATRAEGEILASTQRDLTVKCPAETQTRGQEKKKTTHYSLLIGKNRINFYKGSGISHGSCVKMYSEFYLTLPGGFALPVALIEETVIAYECGAGAVEETECAEHLSRFASNYLASQMIGGQITEFTEQITSDNGTYCLTGEYACTEQIGIVRPEQIGVYYGKTD